MLTSLLCQTGPSSLGPWGERGILPWARSGAGLAAGLGNNLGTPGTHQVCTKWPRILNWGCCPAPSRDGRSIFSL